MAEWALINFIFATLNVFFTLALLVIVLKNKKYDENLGYAVKGNAKATLITFLVSIVVTVAGGIIFLVTENMSTTMVMVDGYTVLQGITFVVQSIVVIFFAATLARDGAKIRKARTTRVA